ncbi:MAG: aminotransferase class V-fold PLP-dependent enzyme [Nitrososphaerales archaeon]
MRDYRKYFEITRKYAYLNNASTGPMSNLVRDAMRKFIDTRILRGDCDWGAWGDAVEETRKLAAELIRSEKKCIAFLKNTSDGINTVAKGRIWKRGDSVIANDLEFPSNIYPWLNLYKEGVRVKMVKHRTDGTIRISDIEKQIDESTKLIAISHVQYSNGFRIDLKELSEISRRNHIPISVDSIQSLGALGVDSKYFEFMAAGGHKWLLAPFGVGILYVAQPTSLDPPSVGWNSVRDPSSFLTKMNLSDSATRFETGNHDYAAIYGLREALKMILAIGILNIEEHILRLTNLVIEGVKKIGMKVVTPLEHRGGIVNIKTKNPLEDVDRLAKMNVIVSARHSQFGIRVSPTFYNNEEDIERLLNALRSL